MKRRVARFLVGSVCPACGGKRLKPEALGVTFAGVDIGTLTQLSLDRMAALLRPAAEGRFDVEATPSAQSTRKNRVGPPGSPGSTPATPSEATLTREASRADTARRVAAGGSAHAGAADVRRTGNLSEEKRIAAQRIAADLLARVATLQGLGLGYLALDRATPTLSPGELQRLRLATQIRSNLFGVVYVLDEPTAGLHPADSEALLVALDQLKRSGNSLFVVEHDLDMMRRADWLVDVGPDAGEHGGRILYSGPPAGLAGRAGSHTARYLFGSVEADRRQARTLRQPSRWLELLGVTRNNLKDLDARIPLGVFTAVTGVSGSGKSSLVSQALVELVGAHLGHEPEREDDGGDGNDLEPTLASETSGRLGAGADAISRLVRVDQKPIGRTPRSNLATYTGLFDPVRKLFAATPAARAKRYDAGRFSFNVAKGRCDTCEGEGFVSVELLFMPSVYAPCPTCHGARYNDATLQIEWHGRNIAEVLQMTVDSARTFFAAEASIARPLALLADIGLGYLRLGQPATELSGGEAQRIKLATELQRAQRGGTLYVLDEPTTGLHPADVDKLMTQLHGLVDSGNSVVVVEHDMRVVAASDWVIDIGPGAGEAGGQIVASGAPADVAAAPRSKTAPYLRLQLEAALRAD